jgi:NSS family neurotransmitter:Na+ symporter
MVLTIWIVGKGVTKGLETAIRLFMPILFLLLVTLLVYSVNSGGFQQGWDFMFSVDPAAFTNPQIWLIAMGQSFFTLSLGMGAMMAYGAYLPDNTGIGGTVVTIAALDTTVAIAAGLAIFPIVFANGLDAAQGPGLMFVTIPLAFGQFPLGAVFGSLFFILVTFAALTSAISLTEPALAYLVEEYNAKRKRVAISLGVICWILGLGTVFSFNVWSDFTVVGGLTVFDFVDYVSQNIMLPLGGLLIAVFAVWVLPKLILRKQLGLESGTAMGMWKIVGGIIAPLGVLAVFINILLPLIEGLFN